MGIWSYQNISKNIMILFASYNRETRIKLALWSSQRLSDYRKIACDYEKQDFT